MLENMVIPSIQAEKNSDGDANHGTFCMRAAGKRLWHDPGQRPAPRPPLVSARCSHHLHQDRWSAA